MVGVVLVRACLLRVATYCAQSSPTILQEIMSSSIEWSSVIYQPEGNDHVAQPATPDARCLACRTSSNSQEPSPTASMSFNSPLNVFKRMSNPKYGYAGVCWALRMQTPPPPFSDLDALCTTHADAGAMWDLLEVQVLKSTVHL